MAAGVIKGCWRMLTDDEDEDFGMNVRGGERTGSIHDPVFEFSRGEARVFFGVYASCWVDCFRVSRERSELHL